MRKYIGWCFNTILGFGIALGLLHLNQAFEKYNDIRNLHATIEIRDFAPGENEERVYVRCMVNKPLDLRWQYSLPPGVELKYKAQLPMRGSVSTIGLRTSTTRVVDSCYVRLKADEPGESRLKETDGRSLSEAGFDPEVGQFLRDNWDALDIQLAGEDCTESFRYDEFITLMRIDVPAALLTESRRVLEDFQAQSLETPIFICVGEDDCEEWDKLESNPILQRYANRKKR
ncbi:MAG TPA: hypothetical protein DDW52_16495 [Planctomycetaceae bacterium]|nr:hypothetical protein [Planctomycetaceae bacterium]